MRLAAALLLSLAAVSASAQTQPARPLSQPLVGAGLQSMLKPQQSLKGLAPGTALAGLKPAGDAAPQCRAQCAKDRVVCGGSDDQDCTDRWTQCLATCAKAQ